MTAILISIAAIAALIVLHELGHLVCAKLAKMDVIRFSIGFGNPLITFRSGKEGTIYQIGWLPLGGYVQIRGLDQEPTSGSGGTGAFESQPLAKRLSVALGGPTANLIVGWLLIACLYVAGRPVASERPVIGDIDPQGAASEVGLRPGDEILAIGAMPVSTWQQLADEIHKRPGLATSLRVRRADGSMAPITVTPKPTGSIGLIGIRPAFIILRTGPVEAMVRSTKDTGRLISGMLGGLWSLIRGNRGNTEVVGPVGIVKIAADELKAGPIRFLAWIAMLNVMLFLFNLFPLPALDGGRLVFLGVEAVIRKRPDPKIEALIHTAGFFVIIGLLVLVTFNDIFRLY